jgi:hypothetical protein
VKALIAIGLLAATLAGSASAANPTVRVHVSNEMTGIYVEGYIWFVALDGAPPRRVTARSVSLPASRGRHALRVFIRPCDGNCSLLDPPVKRCSAPVRSGQTATYHLRDDGCRITVRG